jgi:hypothetical protein
MVRTRHTSAWPPRLQAAVMYLFLPGVAVCSPAQCCVDLDTVVSRRGASRLT